MSNFSKPIYIAPAYSPEYYEFEISEKFAYLATEEGLGVMPLPVEIEIPPEAVTENSISVTLPSPMIPGHYKLRIFNDTDVSELLGTVIFVSPEESELLSMRAIIVRGTKAVDDIRDKTKLAADHAYNALLRQGYTKESIYYISPDKSSENTDAENTFENIRKAITEWTGTEPAASKLVLYIVGHGTENRFIINQNEILDTVTLNNWLNSLQAEMKIPVIVVYDACHSGSFLPQLIPPPNTQRFVIASAAADKSAYFLDKGDLSFSYQFWDGVINDDELENVFLWGKFRMETYQLAKIDANGNGKENETEDYFLASRIRIGVGNITERSIPAITYVSDAQTVYDSSSASLEAMVTESNIERVWAVITPPDFSSDSQYLPVSDLPVLVFEDKDNDKIYTATYSNFSKNGRYKVTVYAKNTQGVYSPFKDTFVTRESSYLISSAAEPQLLYAQNTTARIWAARNRKYNHGLIGRVRAKIISPISSAEVDEIGLSDPENDGIYEAVYDKFTGDGVYQIEIYATDAKGYTSPPVTVTVTHHDQNLYADNYETDNTFFEAGIFSVGRTYFRSFHDSADTDIVKNHLVKGTVYRVMAETSSAGCDPVIQVLRTEANIYLPVTEPVNDAGPGQNESIDFICPATGVYYVMLSNQAPQNFGPNVTYNLKIIRPEAGSSGIINGIVTAPSGMPVEDAVISTDGGGSDMSRNDGSFSITDPVGNRILTVEAQGYDLYRIPVAVSENSPVFVHIVLCPLSVETGDINADESVDLKDALLSLQIAAGKTDFSCAVCRNADVNSDHQIGLAESIFALRKTGGL